jgi:hypothetical protein
MQTPPDAGQYGGEPEGQQTSPDAGRYSGEPIMQTPPDAGQYGEEAEGQQMSPDAGRYGGEPIMQTPPDAGQYSEENSRYNRPDYGQGQQYRQDAGAWQNQNNQQFQQYQQWQGFQQQAPPYSSSYPQGNDYQQYGRYGDPEVPPEIRRWNWGAFMFSWIWGVGTRTWISLLALIPCFNLVFIFILGAKANEWAWKTGEYRDLETFKRVQESWNRAGFVYFWIALGISILSIIWTVALFGYIYVEEANGRGFSEYF